MDDDASSDGYVMDDDASSDGYVMDDDIVVLADKYCEQLSVSLVYGD